MCNISVEKTVECLIKKEVTDNCKQEFDLDILEPQYVVNNQLKEAQFNEVTRMPETGDIYIGATVSDTKVKASYTRSVGKSQIGYDINYVLIMDNNINTGGTVKVTIYKV